MSENTKRKFFTKQRDKEPEASAQEEASVRASRIVAKVLAEKDAKASAQAAKEAKVKAGSEDDEALSGQLQDLRGELKSHLPEPEEFLSFEKASKGRHDEDDPQSPGRFPNSPRFLIRFGIIATAIALIAVGAAVFFLRVEVPSVAGLSAVEASEAVASVGLNFEIFEEESDNVLDGQVISSTPRAGEAAMWGTRVVLRVASNSDTVPVPNVSAMTSDEAQSILAEARLNANIVQTFDDNVPAGQVVGQLPVQNTQFPRGATVTLLVSAGVTEVPLEVPRVIGLSEDAARALLEGMGFNPAFYYGSSTRGEIDQVVAQTPGEGNMVSPGTPVLAMISRGSSTSDHPVPDLAGEHESAAALTVVDAGFVPESFAIIDEAVPSGTVISQMPPAQDVLLRSGEALGYLVSRGGQTDTEIPSVLGLDEAEAVDLLRQEGLRPTIVLDPALKDRVDTLGIAAAGGIITQQFPSGGSQYHVGLPVLIYLSMQD